MMGTDTVVVTFLVFVRPHIHYEIKPDISQKYNFSQDIAYKPDM